jgi:glycosyltransferase involved in cell wall biosynthesis
MTGKRKRLVFTVTNGIRQDQRMQRICATLQGEYDVLLIGRKLDRNALPAFTFSTKRLPCFFKSGKLFYLEFNVRLFFILLFSNVDAYCAVDPDTLLANTFSSILRRKPLMYDSHELFTEVPELNGRSVSKAIWGWIERFGIQRAKLRYTVNQSIADLLYKKYGRSFYVIRNVPQGIPYASEISRTDSTMIWYQGVLNEGRGLEQLLVALSLLPEHWTLELAGNGDLKEKLVQLTKSLGLENRVVFHGFLERKQLIVLSGKAFLGVNLLEDVSRNYYYSLANKFFDYVQQDLPQLCMDFPEYRQLNEQFQVAALINRLDPHEIAGAIQDLHEHSIVYHDMKVAIQQARYSWVWEHEAPFLINLYRKYL